MSRSHPDPMRKTTTPTKPKSPLSASVGEGADLERLRKWHWRTHGAVTVPVTDERLRPDERAQLEAIGARLFGPRRG